MQRSIVRSGAPREPIPGCSRASRTPVGITCAGTLSSGRGAGSVAIEAETMLGEEA